MNMKRTTVEDLSAIYNQAKEASRKAAADKRAELGGDRMPAGFAWVTIRPGTCSFARWLKEHDIGDRGCYGGREIWDPSDARIQSIDIKKAGAEAFAAVVKAAGIKCSIETRLD